LSMRQYPHRKRSLWKDGRKERMQGRKGCECKEGGDANTRKEGMNECKEGREAGKAVSTEGGGGSFWMEGKKV
jgi:hypothetical protein